VPSLNSVSTISQSELNSEPAIELSHVSKLFRRQKQRTVKELLPALFGGQSAVESFWALNDISLTIQKGETIGIIGPNGSGKSTLLKLIAGVSQPTKGTIKIHGRIAPLIELGAGFHPELTGRENVFLNGVILGMTRAEVEAKFKTIVDFAELWDFIDEPVKHYSSGMYLRLAFSVAVNTNPEILLIDEILAVGDEAFQNKCFNRLKEFKHSGKTIIYVSHNRKSIVEFCTRVVYINKSHLEKTGLPSEVCQYYSETEA